MSQFSSWRLQSVSVWWAISSQQTLRMRPWQARIANENAKISSIFFLHKIIRKIPFLSNPSVGGGSQGSVLDPVHASSFLDSTLDMHKQIETKFERAHFV